MLDLVFVGEVGDLADAVFVELNNVEDCTVEEFDPVFVEEISGLMDTVRIEPNGMKDSAALMFVPELVFVEEIVEIGAVVLVELNKVERWSIRYLRVSTRVRIPPMIQGVGQRGRCRWYFFLCQVAPLTKLLLPCNEVL